MTVAFTQQPKQFLSESEKTAEWYKNNIRFILSHFNRRHDRVTSVPRQHTLDNPVDEIVRMYTYYLGRQENRDYHYTNKDENNCDLPTVWINGQKITGLVDYMVGSAIKLIDNIEPSVRSQSRPAINRKTQLLDQALLKFDAPEIFETFAQMGYQYSPLGNKTGEMETPEDVYRFMENDYRDYSEEVAIRLCEDILLRNDARNKYKQAMLFTLLGGFVGIEHRIENAKQYFDVILPHNLITDRSKDDDFNSEARFVGKIDWITVPDIIERYQDQLTEEQLVELKNLNSQNLYNMLELTGHPYMTTWAFNFNNVPTLAMVTGYWIGMKDLGYEKKTDKYGNTHFSRIRNGRKGEFWTKTVYQATLIGNRYVVNAKEATNIVRKHDNPGDVELPLKVFIPNMVLGENRSVVGRLHQHQDRIDYFTNEITKMVNRAKGKVHVINKQKLGSATSQELLNDFTRIGIHVTDGAANGEDYVPGSDSKIVEVVDMTLDPNVQVLISLRREEERLMEEIVNIPKIALGQQQGYVGAKTQAGTIAQSNLGTTYLYQGFIEFIQKNLAFGINQFRVSSMVESETEIPVVGTRGKAWIKLTKEFQNEELGVYIKVKDFIDDAGRERIINLAQAAMQNQMIDLADYLNIEQARTYTELVNDLKYSLNKKKREAEKAAMMQQIMQEAQMAQQAAAQQQLQGMREEGANYRAEVGAQSQIAANMAKEAIKQPEAAPEAVPAQ